MHTNLGSGLVATTFVPHIDFEIISPLIGWMSLCFPSMKENNITSPILLAFLLNFGENPL